VEVETRIASQFCLFRSSCCLMHWRFLQLLSPCKVSCRASAIHPGKASDRLAVLGRQASVLENAAARRIEVMVGPQNMLSPEIRQPR